MSSTTPIKVAAVQAAPVSFDLDASLEKLQRLTAQAAEAGADIVVFPWVFLRQPVASSSTETTGI